MDRRYVTSLHSFYPSVFWWGSWSQWEEMPIELQYLEDAQHCPRVVLEGYERNKTWCRSRKTQTQHIHSNVVFPAWETRLIQSVRDRKSVEVTEIPTAWLKMGGAHLFLPFPWPHSQPCLHSIPKWRSRGSRNRRDANKLTVRSWMDGVKPRSWRVRSKSVLSCKLSADKSIFVGIERVAKTHVEGLRLCPQPRVLHKSKSSKSWLWDRAPCCGTWRQRHILASSNLNNLSSSCLLKPYREPREDAFWKTFMHREHDVSGQHSVLTVSQRKPEPKNGFAHFSTLHTLASCWPQALPHHIEVIFWHIFPHSIS